MKKRKEKKISDLFATSSCLIRQIRNCIRTKHLQTTNVMTTVNMANTPDDLKEHLSKVEESLSHLRTSCQESVTTHSPTISNTLEVANVAQPLNEVPKLSSLLSAHATKLGLVFKPPIAITTYKACRTEVDSLLKYAALLVSLLNQIQEEKEKYSSVFANELSSDGLSVLEACVALISGLKELVSFEEATETVLTDQRLVGVGFIWEACEKLTKTCKNGSSGVLRSKLKQTNRLVVDALNELNEWLENPIVGGGFDFDEEDIFGLSNDIGSDGEEEKAEDKVIAFGKLWSTRIQLVKLLVSLLDKSVPASKYNPKFSKGLDALNAKCLKVSEHVDDVVACTVYDANVESGELASKSLAKEINQIVDLTRKINNNDEKKCKWLDSWKTKFEE